MVSEHNAVTSEETRNTYLVNNKLFRCLITLWWFLLLVITGPGSQESCRPVCHGVLRDDIFTSSQNRFTCMIATTENWFLIITESGNYYEANYPNSHFKKKPHLKEVVVEFQDVFTLRFGCTLLNGVPLSRGNPRPSGQTRTERDHVT